MRSITFTCIKHSFIFLNLIVYAQDPELPFKGGDGQGFFSNAHVNNTCQIVDALNIFQGGLENGRNVGSLSLASCQSVVLFTPFSGRDGDGFASASLITQACESVSNLNIYSGGIRSGFAHFRRIYINCDGENSTIISVEPTVVCPGDSITIYGTMLSNIDYVEFVGAFTDGFFVLSDSVVVSVVPQGAQNGPVTVTGPNGTVSSASNLTVNSPPDATFSFEQVSGLTVNFFNQNLSATNYLWDFGDGNTASGSSPSHTFASTGSYEVSLIASNSCGADTFLTTVNVINVGIAVMAVPSIKLFPNPFHESFQLEINGMDKKLMQIEVWSMFGQLIHSRQIEGERDFTLQIPTAHLASGVYLIRLSTEEYLKTLRAVKH